MVHRTEVIKNTLNPTWKPFKISMKALCGGDHDTKLMVSTGIAFQLHLGLGLFVDCVYICIKF